MKTIDRFMLKSYIGPMILTFFLVMFVLMMNFLWRYIDELVGKGLAGGVIAELMLYAVIGMIEMGLPLATLFAAIMTMGNLGENYELLAMKSCGMSLTRILAPLFIITTLIAIGGFFVSNNLVPYSNRKMAALLWDIDQQKQTIEFKDGLFFNGIPDMSIRIDKQDPETGLLTNVLIYNNSNVQGKMSTTVADSGYIKLSDDGQFLLVTLYNGESYEQSRHYKWFEENELVRNYFEEQNMVMETKGFSFSRTDESLFSDNFRTKNVVELEHGVDSLSQVVTHTNTASFKPFFDNLFANDSRLTKDSIIKSSQEFELGKHKVYMRDSITKMSIYDKRELWANALNSARNSRNSFSFEEDLSKDSLSQLYRHQIELHRKLSLPVSIIIFFVIGASLGAIIRKGGLGMPIIVSVSFFVVYYIITITGEKMAREGTWTALHGMWLSSYILLPIAVFLLYKATNDSNLFNADWYIARLKKVKAFIMNIIGLFRKDKNNIHPAESV